MWPVGRSAALGRVATQLGSTTGDCFAYALATVRAEPLLYTGYDFARTDTIAAAAAADPARQGHGLGGAPGRLSDRASPETGTVGNKRNNVMISLTYAENSIWNRTVLSPEMRCKR